MKTTLESYIDWLKHNIKISEQYKLEPKLLNVCLENAERFLPMEKEQIINAWDNGYANGYDLGKHDDQPNPDDAEQYYNENFKSK